MTRKSLEIELNEYLEKEKTGEGAGLTKDFKIGLSGFLFELLSKELKEVTDQLDITHAIPEASGKLLDKFPYKIGDELYYVIFKKVKHQDHKSIKQEWGWQFTVLRGKAEEIQIRNDYGVLYKMSGDYVLVDFIYRDEKEAWDKCKHLNKGVV